jgi:hypothetical protein
LPTGGGDPGGGGEPGCSSVTNPPPHAVSAIDPNDAVAVPKKRRRVKSACAFDFFCSAITSSKRSAATHEDRRAQD